MTTPIYTKGLIVIAVFLFVPIIMYYLEKYMRKSFPASSEIAKILSKVDKDTKLKKSIERYCKIWTNVGAFSWLGFVLITFFTLWPTYSDKYGPNSPVYVLPLILIFSSLAPIFNAYHPIFMKIFKVMHPKVDTNLFFVYSSYYFPNERFTPSRKVDYIKFNTKILNISMIIFIPTLILAILLAVI